MNNLKIDRVKKMKSYGEEPPKHWTCAQIKARLSELKMENGDMNTTPMKQLEKELGQIANKKKIVLQEYMTSKGVQITGNETKDQLVSLGLRTFGAQMPGHSEDSLGFGTHASMTYGEVKNTVPSYAAWVIKTYQEGGGQAGDSSWRLKRFAKWLIEDQKPLVAKPKPLMKPPQDHQDVMTFSSAEDSSSSLRKGYQKVATPPAIVDSEEEMASDTEIKIAELESQLRDLQRGRKGHRAQ